MASAPRGDRFEVPDLKLYVHHHQTQSSITPFYVCEVRRHNDQLANVVVAKLEPIAGLDEEAAAIRASLKSGWLNAYLAV